MIALGFDTSCYTTSIALCDDETLIGDARRMLPVEEGELGLRQSEALFHHNRHMPELMEQLAETIQKNTVGIIACSATPRPVEGSYMPVFLSGEQTARILAATLGVECLRVSHQEGHVRAAVWSAGFDDREPFLALHLSGGTTEILMVRKAGIRYEVELLGGTKDISAGMLLDRTGVMLGFPFPAGKYIDQLAIEQEKPETLFPVSVRDTWLNFSGLENKAQQALSAGNSQGVIAWNVLDAVSRSLAKAVAAAVRETGCRRVLFSGGVAASLFLRNSLKSNKLLKGINVVFAENRYSVDNAVGVALMGIDYMKRGVL